MIRAPCSALRCPETELDALARYRAAAPGEPEAQRDLIETLSPIIRWSVTRRIRLRARSHRAVDQEIDDLVQNALLAIFAEESGPLDAWDPARGLDLEAFVAFVAAREVDTWLRDPRKNPWTEEPVVADALEQVPVCRVGIETLAGSRCLLLTVTARLRARISPVGMAIFEMLFLQERAPRDVAAALGLGLPAVYTWKSRLSRAARTIVTEIEGEFTPSPAPAAPSPRSGEKPGRLRRRRGPARP